MTAHRLRTGSRALVAFVALSAASSLAVTSSGAVSAAGVCAGSRTHPVSAGLDLGHPAPVLSGFAPSSGKVKAAVTLSGSGFTGAKTVRFDGVKAKFTVISDAGISTAVPRMALTGPITVTTPGGTATSSDPFGVTPVLKSFSPTSGPPGTRVMIIGSALTDATSVSLGSIQAAFTVLGYTSISATVPAGASTGRFAVTTPGGTATSAESFTVTPPPPPPPSISGFDPDSGPVGTQVVISGSGFTGTTEVDFGSTPAVTYSVDADDQITAMVPFGATTGTITVTTTVGTATSDASFSVTPPPSVSGFDPNSGPAGTQVVISGSGFTGATEVGFGCTEATSYSVDSDLQITAAVPFGATTGTITVTTPGGTATSDGSFTVSPSPIRHVVIIDQENHSFDNVLGKLCVIEQRCDGSTKGLWPDGHTAPLGQATDVVSQGAHDPLAEQTAIDAGAMDGFPKILDCGAPDYPCMTQFDPSQIPNLAALARRFVISDRTFMSDNMASWGSHLSLVSATLDGFLGDNPDQPGGAPIVSWGCDSGATTPWSSDGGGTWQTEYSCVPMPDGTFVGVDGSTVHTLVPWVPTIMDRLDAAGLSWKLYSSGPSGSGYGWAMCPTFADCLQTSQRQNLVPANTVLSAAASGSLPAFSIVTPLNTNSQHNKTSMAIGDNWIGQVVSAIENGPDWSSTAIFITYDDCGCFYDHVAPPGGLSLREPMVIVSPYAKPGYTDHRTASFASLLAFVEHNWSIPPLSAQDASAYDFSDSFDLGQELLAPVRMITTRVPASERRWIAAHPDLPDDPT